MKGRKQQANLARRIKGYDETVRKMGNGFKRPGSNKK